eukprot:5075090-Heterocapsa_arctica.AAC.1
MLIQEHWRLKEELRSWETLAYLKGWQGVWEPAKVTEKDQNGVTGRSRGVAILTWSGRLILTNTFEADYRALGATIGWEERKLCTFSKST